MASLVSRIDAALENLASRQMAKYELWPSYPVDLGLEALLVCYDVTGDQKYLRHVERVWEYRDPPDATLTFGNSYFTCLHYETYIRNGNPRLITGMVELAADWLENAPRDSRGIIGHRKCPYGALLADLLGGLPPLLARAGKLSGHEEFYSESVRQLSLYREALRDPVTGLWHHAKNWHGQDLLSPAGWCRGFGWMLRGLEKTFEALPANHQGRSLILDFWDEALGLLLTTQNSRGVWHQLLHRPDSYSESSGTGFAIAALARPEICRREASDLDPLVTRAIGRAATGLMDFIDLSGAVSGGCPECPPQRSESDYLIVGPRSADPHAQAAVLIALARLRSLRGRGFF